MPKVAIVWLRRNLRLEDNKPFAAALRNATKVLPIFIFDTTILKRFHNPYDRRLSFLANTLCLINNQLNKIQGKLFVLHGIPLEIIPKLVNLLGVEAIYADEDYEPANLERDRAIQKVLPGHCALNLYCDHLLIRPDAILTKYNDPYKVYTPYMRAFRTYLVNQGELAQNKLLIEYTYQLEGKLFVPPEAFSTQSIDLNLGEKAVLEQVGYVYTKDRLWDPKNAHNVLDGFTKNKINDYKLNRDFLDLNGTSSCSPYLRFGLISIRSCYRNSLALESNLGTTTWVNELIWREFYAYILYHFPNTVDQPFQEKYRGISWSSNQEHYDKFVHAQTGYPIIDAAVKQLLLEGWMHNRARMIVASFFTKNLLLDWRKGENFFAQHLMDYELASNVGGWQWSSSCGTDAQPYFRVFNPYLQGKKFDPDAHYVKKYLLSLKTISADLIHNVDFHKIYKDYLPPIVDYRLSRIRAIETFKKAGN